jgi:hypothetical protein
MLVTFVFSCQVDLTHKLLHNTTAASVMLDIFRRNAGAKNPEARAQVEEKLVNRIVMTKTGNHNTCYRYTNLIISIPSIALIRSMCVRFVFIFFRCFQDHIDCLGTPGSSE